MFFRQPSTKHRNGPMQRVSILLSLIVLVLCQAELAKAANEPANEARKPNVILIMTDDMGYGDVGIHGNTMLKTPHLDQLAKQSVRMTDFHVDPTCAETRAAFMTGRYSCRTGVWHTIMGRSILRQDELTMADVFQSNADAAMDKIIPATCIGLLLAKELPENFGWH